MRFLPPNLVFPVGLVLGTCVLAPAALAGGGAHPAAEALPLYIRDKVAQTTEERAADRARKEMRRGASAAESR